MAKKLFIVEDEPDLLDLYIETFELFGHEVIASARNGAEAVQTFSNLQERPDIIIMDHRMPIKNGLDAAIEILKIDPDAVIFFASADQSIEHEAAAIGAAAFLKKPFDMDALFSRIENIAAAGVFSGDGD